MIFSSLSYFIFFGTILSVLTILRSASWKRRVLLLGSYFFYGFWDWRFVFLMLGMSFANYLIGKKIFEAERQSDGKRWVTLSVIINLSILGVFKYFNFFIDSFNTFLAKINWELPGAAIILPVGISFITFELLSYTIDIYRKDNRPANSFSELALLVAFFPHLIAGPILKPKDFLPQLEKEIKIQWKNIEPGIQLFLMGLAKKLLIADNVAPFVDNVFKSPAEFTGLTVWLAVIAYAIQIYCDFSGYSDMAIGSAKCLGFDIPRNFHMPYNSLNITEFWRRWHISLSTWLREYLYISLGGNRVGKIKQYRNLMLTMLLGGLWHGASWNFVVWGGLHGLALVIHKLYKEHILAGRTIEHPLYKVLAWLGTFTFVCIAWVFFRSPNFATSIEILKKLSWIAGSDGTVWYATWALQSIAILTVFHLYMRNREQKFFSLSTANGLFAFFFVILGVLFLSPINSSPFIYFQF